MADLQTAYEITLKNEYGYTPPITKDPGGETFDGIDRRDNADWAGWKFVDELKSTAAKGLKLGNYLRKDPKVREARDAYYATIWEKLLLDKVVNQSVANNIFDAYINPGAASIKIVQEWCGATKDGIIGQKTINAINASNPQSLIFALYTWKKGYYEARPQSLKDEFLAGWMSRAEKMRTA